MRPWREFSWLPASRAGWFDFCPCSSQGSGRKKKKPQPHSCGVFYPVNARLLKLSVRFKLSLLAL